MLYCRTADEKREIYAIFILFYEMEYIVMTNEQEEGESLNGYSIPRHDEEKGRISKDSSDEQR